MSRPHLKLVAADGRLILEPRWQTALRRAGRSVLRCALVLSTFACGIVFLGGGLAATVLSVAQPAWLAEVTLEQAFLSGCGMGALAMAWGAGIRAVRGLDRPLMRPVTQEETEEHDDVA